MAAFEIPLTPESQTFAITLAGVAYHVAIKWNAIGGVWTLDILNENEERILCGIPLVTGADLLAQYAYLNFNGQMFVQTDHDLDALPTFDNLGESSHLYFVTVDSA